MIGSKEARSGGQHLNPAKYPLHPLVLWFGKLRSLFYWFEWTSRRKIDAEGLSGGEMIDDFADSIGKTLRGFRRCAFLVHASLICMAELFELPMA